MPPQGHVLGKLGIQKDPVRDDDQSVHGRGHEGGKRLLVTPLRSADQIGLHRLPLDEGSLDDPVVEYERRW